MSFGNVLSAQLSKVLLHVVSFLRQIWRHHRLIRSHSCFLQRVCDERRNCLHLKQLRRLKCHLFIHLPPNCSNRNGQRPHQAPGDCGDPASACNFCLAGHHCCLSKHSESTVPSSRGLMGGTRKLDGLCWRWQSQQRKRKHNHFIQQCPIAKLYRLRSFCILQRGRATVVLWTSQSFSFLSIFLVSQTQKFTTDPIHTKIQIISSVICAQQIQHHTHKQ